MLALAISLEEDDWRTYVDYAERPRENFPGSAAIFDGMANEEAGHRLAVFSLGRALGWHRGRILKQFARADPLASK
jgi:rubrerythrin